MDVQVIANRPPAVGATPSLRVGGRRRPLPPSAGPSAAAGRAATAGRSDPWGSGNTGRASAGIGHPGSGAPAPSQPAREADSHPAHPPALRRPVAGKPIAALRAPRDLRQARWRCCPHLPCPPSGRSIVFKPRSGVFGIKTQSLARLRGPADLSLRPPRLLPAAGSCASHPGLPPPAPSGARHLPSPCPRLNLPFPRLPLTPLPACSN